jgi:hypothetical protein
MPRRLKTLLLNLFLKSQFKSRLQKTSKNDRTSETGNVILSVRSCRNPQLIKWGTDHKSSPYFPSVSAATYKETATLQVCGHYRVQNATWFIEWLAKLNTRIQLGLVQKRCGTEAEDTDIGIMWLHSPNVVLKKMQLLRFVLLPRFSQLHYYISTLQSSFLDTLSAVRYDSLHYISCPSFLYTSGRDTKPCYILGVISVMCCEFVPRPDNDEHRLRDQGQRVRLHDSQLCHQCCGMSRRKVSGYCLQCI